MDWMNKEVVIMGDEGSCNEFVRRCGDIVNIVGSVSTGEKICADVLGNGWGSWYRATKIYGLSEVIKNNLYVVVCMSNGGIEGYIYQLLYNYGLRYCVDYIDYYIILMDINNCLKKKISQHDGVIIWGIKNRGMQVYTAYRDKLKFVAFTDTYGSESPIKGLPFMEHNNILAGNSSLYIFIASSYYTEIKQTLIDAGYAEFEDFCSSMLYDERELLLFHGTCQTMSSLPYLCRRSNIMNKFFVRTYHVIGGLNPAVESKWDYCLPRCKVVIYNNGGFTNDKIIHLDKKLKQLPDDVKIIKMPSYEFKGQIVQATGAYNERAIQLRYENESVSYWFINDKNVIELMREGKTEKEICDILSSEDFYSKDFVEKNLIKEIRKVELMDEISDIKLTPYIKEHCYDELVFSDGTHFMPKLNWEIAGQLITLLELEDYADEKMLLEVEEEKVGCFPIYPSVQRSLGMPRQICYRRIAVNTPRRGFTYEEWDINRYVELCYKYNVLVDKLIELGNC